MRENRRNRPDPKDDEYYGEFDKSERAVLKHANAVRTAIERLMDAIDRRFKEHGSCHRDVLDTVSCLGHRLVLAGSGYPN